MSWARGVNSEGREVGYAIPGICEEDGCAEKIDLGLGYVCGGMHDGGDHGCGRYFCGEHLYYVNRPTTVREREESGQLCGECAYKHRCAECWEDEEDLAESNGRLLCPACLSGAGAA